MSDDWYFQYDGLDACRSKDGMHAVMVEAALPESPCPVASSLLSVVCRPDFSSQPGLTCSHWQDDATLSRSTDSPRLETGEKPCRTPSKSQVLVPHSTD